MEGNMPRRVALADHGRQMSVPYYDSKSKRDGSKRGIKLNTSQVPIFNPPELGMPFHLTTHKQSIVTISSTTSSHMLLTP
jgi:hypothetical protein